MAISSIFVVSDSTDVLTELCAGARSLANRVTAVVYSDQAGTDSLAGCGADSLFFCPTTDAAFEDYASAIADEVKKESSAVVIVYNSIRGRQIAGKIGVYLDTAVLSSINEAEAADDKLFFRRVVYGGTAQRKEYFTKPYGVVTVGSGIFECNASGQTAASISPLTAAPQAGVKLVSRNEKTEGTVNLVAAKRIVDVGRGLAAEEDLAMCRSLAEALGGEVGCSRPVAENNKWMPKSSYLGITGVQVKPELLIALGVSGQVQHIGGINKSKVIVAINKDKAAPIFKNADFGLVGDMYKIVPALIEKL